MGKLVFLGEVNLTKSIINNERPVLIGRPLFEKEATVAKLMGLRLLGLRNPNNIAVACIYLLNDGSEEIFIVKATQQHIQRALPGFVFGCQICSTAIT